MIKQMVAIIGIYGILAAVFVIIFANKVIYSLAGLLIGCIAAAYMLIYMNLVLNRCMGFEAKAVEKYVIKHSVIRYFTVVIIFGIVCITDIANPITCFVGLLGLKISAYLQPIAHKLMNKKAEI